MVLSAPDFYCTVFVQSEKGMSNPLWKMVQLFGAGEKIKKEQCVPTTVFLMKNFQQCKCHIAKIRSVLLPALGTRRIYIRPDSDDMIFSYGTLFVCLDFPQWLLWLRYFQQEPYWTPYYLAIFIRWNVTALLYERCVVALRFFFSIKT